MGTTNAMLFILGLTSITSIYEIAVTGKKSRSDKVRKSGEQIVRKK